MEPAHYAGLFRLRAKAPSDGPPRYDPGYPVGDPASADVTVRDLAIYEAVADGGIAGESAI